MLHTLAIANEAEIDYDLTRINEVAERVPYLCKISPASDYSMDDVHKAGGVAAIMKELIEMGAVKGDRITITGKSLYENVAHAQITNTDVIRTKETAYSPVGGLSILYGNLAPDGAVIKVGAVDPSIKTFTGKRSCLIPKKKRKSKLITAL